jgi:hypothetical protein
MNHDTDHLSLDELIALLESNLGYGRPTGDNEVKRLIARIRELQTKNQEWWLVWSVAARG